MPPFVVDQRRRLAVLRAALDFVAHDGVVEVAVRDREIGNVIDIEVVSLAIAGTIQGEFRIVDRDRARQVGGRQQTILIVVEIDVVQRETAALVANGCAIPVRNFRATDIETVDRDVDATAALVDDGLAVRRGHGGNHLHDPSNRLQRDALERGDEVVGVGARLHIDGVTGLRRRHGGRDRGILLTGTDRQAKAGRYIYQALYLHQDRMIGNIDRLYVDRLG